MLKKRTVTVRGLEIGGGRTKICIPLTARTEAEAAAIPETWTEGPCDLVEWRADFFEGLEDARRLDGMLRLIREKIGDKPLLFTVRTKAEGGLFAGGPEMYARILETAADTGCADLIDIEAGRENAGALTARMHEKGLYVVGSYHSFEETPPTDEIVGKLCGMQEMGMDITKAAVMPRSRADVVRLLEAAVRMEEEAGDRPCITMSMGTMGVLSRVSGCLTGCAVTFASRGEASAPGQLSADDAAQILNIL